MNWYIRDIVRVTKRLRTLESTSSSRYHQYQVLLEVKVSRFRVVTLRSRHGLTTVSPCLGFRIDCHSYASQVIPRKACSPEFFLLNTFLHFLLRRLPMIYDLSLSTGTSLFLKKNYGGKSWNTKVCCVQTSVWCWSTELIWGWNLPFFLSMKWMYRVHAIKESHIESWDFNGDFVSMWEAVSSATRPSQSAFVVHGHIWFFKEK
jgi:hypothetical protein